jgi:hypothetical protein
MRAKPGQVNDMAKIFGIVVVCTLLISSLWAQSPTFTATVSPSSGLGNSETFSFQFSDSAGVSDVQAVRIIINSQLLFTNACAILYDPTHNLFYLLNDNATSWGIGGAPGPGVGPNPNSECALDLRHASASAVGNDIKLSFTVNFTPAFAGNKTIYGSFIQTNGQTSNWLVLGSWQSTPSPPVTATPVSGSGDLQTFMFRFSDGVAGDDIGYTQMLINSTLSFNASCTTLYDVRNREIYLLDDAADSWGTPMVLGSAGTLQNSQCVLDVSKTAAAGLGKAFYISLVLSFKHGFEGVKSVYGQEQSITAGPSGWINTGTYQVSEVSAISMTNSGSGSTQLHTYQFSDINGAGSIDFVEILNANTSVSPVESSCWILYDPQHGDQVYVMNDAQTSWGSPVVLGTPVTLQNSACTLNVGQSSVTKSGRTLSLALSLTTVQGDEEVFARAQDIDGTLSVGTGKGILPSYQPVGQWSTAASTLSVTPSSGTGESSTFSFQFSDVNGFSHISGVHMLITAPPPQQPFLSPALFAIPSCLIQFSPQQMGIALLDDAGHFGPPVSIGTPGVLQNSQCALDVGQSSAIGSGNMLTVNLALSFKAGLVGFDNIYGEAEDTFTSNFELLGTWHVNPLSSLTVAPASGSGSTQTFSFVASDVDGASDIQWIETNVNATASFVNGCSTFYDPKQNIAYLLSDDASSWSAPGTVGAAGTLQNNQCTLDLGSSSVSVTGDNINLNLALSFKSGFNGAKNVYGSVRSYTGNNLSLSTLGNWTVP